MKIKYKILKLIVRFKIYIKNKRIKQIYNDLSKPHILTINIILKLLKNKHTTLMVAPLSGERYIQLYEPSLGITKTPDTFVVIEKNKVIIINHYYHYIFDINDNLYGLIIYEFDKETERRRRKMKKEIINNIVNSLIEIDKDIKINF